MVGTSGLADSGSSSVQAGSLLGPEWLLFTKLAAPAPRSQLSPRPRLLARLEEGLRRPLTVVSAPAGFGKTTLLATWRATPAGARCPLAWVSLDAGDNDPSRFWNYVVVALQAVCPAVGEAVLTMLRSPEVQPEAAPAAIVRRLASLDDDIVLALDDFELIDAEPIHRGLTFLLDHMPPRFHLVVLSRTEPPLPLARLRARGQLVEVGADLLRFDVQEAATFLTETMGRVLSDDMVGALASATEGWAAGLQLAALALDGQREPLEFIAHFSGGHRYVLDYLVEEVLQRQSRPIQDFLLQTAILGRLSGPLCDAVTSGQSGQVMLEQLERAHLFLVPLDAERRWYRYHLLFREALRHRLQTLDPSAAAGLHARAAAWFEQQGLASEAVEHSLLGCDWPETLRRIEPLVDNLTERCEWATLDRWLVDVPEAAISTNSALCFARAWSCLYAGRLDDAERFGLLAGKRAEEAGSGFDQGTADAFRAHIAAVRGDASATLEHAHRALTRLPVTASARRSVALVHAGFGHLLLGELDEAAAMLEQAVTLSFAADVGVFIGVQALGHLGHVRQLQGDLAESERLYREVLRRCDGDRPRDQVRAMIRLGNLLRERNMCDEAAELVETAIQLDERQGGRYLREGYVVLARIQAARGEIDAALHALDQAEAYADRVGHSAAGRRARAYGARLRLTAGDLAGAARWAARVRFADDNLLRPEHEVEVLTLVRVWIAQGQSDDALELLDRIRRLAEAAGRLPSLVEVLVLEALAWAARHDGRRALASLTRAARLAEPAGFVRLFADEGAALVRPLEALVAAQRRGAPIDDPRPSLGYARRLLAALLGRPDAPAPAVTPPHRASVSSQAALLEPLSPRELDVLRLMATGITNQQIADNLVVAVTTVKTHVNSIFRKLNAANRFEAVTRARELGLFS